MKRVLLAALLSTTAQAKTYDVSGKVSYLAEGNAGVVKVTGEAPLIGKAEDASGKVKGEFTVKLREMKDASWDTRTEHTKDLFQIQKWPVATLTLDPWTPTSEESPFTGRLTLKGVSKAVKGVASLSGGKLKAGFTWKLKDYPFDEPRHMGVGIARDSDITVSVEADVK